MATEQHEDRKGFVEAFGSAMVEHGAGRYDFLAENPPRYDAVLSLDEKAAWFRETLQKATAAAKTALALLAVTLASCALIGCATEEVLAGLPGVQQAEVVRVIDGDTLLVDVGGKEAKVRLIGIDAPESVHPDPGLNTPEGSAAAEHMRTLVHPGQEVYLERDVSETDRYGRLLRYVWIADPEDDADPGASMLNAAMVAAGHARAKDYPPDTMHSDMLHALDAQGR